MRKGVSFEIVNCDRHLLVGDLIREGISIMDESGVIGRVLGKNRIGVFTIEIGEDGEEKLFCNDVMLKNMGFSENLSPRQLYCEWYERIEKRDLTVVDKAFEKMRNGETAEVLYKWNHPDGSFFLARSGGSRNFDRKDVLCIEGLFQNVSGYFNFQNNEEQITLKNLAQNFIAVFFADLTTDYIHAYSVTPEYEQRFLNATSYSETMLEYAMNCVKEEDRKRFKIMSNPMFVMRQFRGRRSFRINIVDITKGKERKLCVNFIKADEEGKKAVIFGIDNTQIIKKTSEATALKQKLEDYSVISSLTDDFEYVAHVDFVNRKVTSYRETPKGKKWKNAIENMFTDKVSAQKEIEEIIYKDDVKIFKEQLEKVHTGFDTEDKYSFTIRLCLEETPEFYSIRYTKDPNNEKAFIAGIMNVDGRVRAAIKADIRQKKLSDYVSALIGNMPAIIYSKDMTTGRYLACNQSFANFIGLEGTAGIVGKTDADIFDAKTCKIILANDQQALSQKKAVVTFETVTNAKRKQCIFQTTRIQYVDDDENLCLLAISVDITDTMKQQEQLEEQLSVISAIADEYDYVGVYDIKKNKTKTIHVRSHIKELVDRVGERGSSFEDFRNGLLDKVYPEDRELFYENASPDRIMKNLQRFGGYRFRVRFIYGGTDKYFRIQFSPSEANPNSVVVGAINVDDQVRSEIARGEAEGYRKAQSFADAFLDSYVSAYYVDLNDFSHIVFHRNIRIEEKYGHYENFLESISEYINTDVYEKDRNEMIKAVNPDYIRARLQKEDKFSVYMRDISGSGVRWFRFDVNKGTDEDHVGMSFTDVTEKIQEDERIRVKLEDQQKELENALNLAESANRAKTVFLNSMSHDIRTPMNAIIGFTNLASKHIDKTEQVRDYLNKINQSSEHLLSLINDVLDMSRIESGKMDIIMTPESIADIMEVLQNIVASDVSRKKQHFSIDIEGINDDCVVCDKLRLNQILLNLVSNAVKYTPEGGVISVAVRQFSSEKEGYGRYEFVVKDNGTGMTQEFASTIFEPFTREQTATVTGIQGTGLGMTITKSIVEMMGGSISLETQKGVGTQFTINLEFEISTEKTEKQAPLPEYNYAGKKVLLVEDNELNREIATEILTDSGFIVDTANDGTIAVSKMENADENTYDVILMDVQMPIMGGFEATKIIRKQNKTGAKIPIIAMTANAFEEDRKLALEAQMNDYIPKPIEIGKMLEIISKYI